MNRRWNGLPPDPGPDLRGLPRRVPPAELRTSLQVIASRDRQRRLAQHQPWWLLNMVASRASLFFENVVGAFAVPAAGGVFSAVLLFMGFVVPAYPVLRAQSGADIPTSLATEVSLISMGAFGASDLGVSESDLVVDVSVDGQGRMMDYVVVAGTLARPEIRRRLENALVVSKFAPATTFGQGMPSKVRLWFRSSRVDVRG